MMDKVGENERNNGNLVFMGIVSLFNTYLNYLATLGQEKMAFHSTFLTRCMSIATVLPREFPA